MQWNWPVGGFQERPSKPPLHAPGVADDCRERHDLGAGGAAVGRSKKREQELEIGTAALVADGLHLVDHNQGDRPHDVRIAEHQVEELLVRQERQVELAVEDGADLICELAGGSDGGHRVAVDAAHVLVLVVHQGSERQQHDGAAAVRDCLHRGQLADHGLACAGRSND